MLIGISLDIFENKKKDTISLLLKKRLSKTPNLGLLTDNIHVIYIISIICV